MTSESATDEKPISFSSRGQPSLLLEGVLHTPNDAELAPIIILCHPQPASSDMNDTDHEMNRLETALKSVLQREEAPPGFADQIVA